MANKRLLFFDGDRLDDIFKACPLSQEQFAAVMGWKGRTNIRNKLKPGRQSMHTSGLEKLVAYLRRTEGNPSLSQDEVLKRINGQIVAAQPRDANGRQLPKPTEADAALAKRDDVIGPRESLIHFLNFDKPDQVQAIRELDPVLLATLRASLREASKPRKEAV